MAEISVRCPGCEARVRVPATKTAVRCRECGTTVRVHDPAEGADDPDVRRLLSKVKIVERVQGEEARPARRREEEEDEDERDRPRRRRRDREDEDDRPRRRRQSDETQEGPWLIAIGATVGGFLLALGLAFLIFGKAGLPAGQDGPGGKLLGLGIGLVAALVLIPVGIVGVKNRRAMGKWGIEIEGTMGVATGFVQSIIGALVAGFALYGLIFTLVNGR